MKSLRFNPGMVISSFTATGTFTIPPFSLLLFTPVTCSSGSWGQWEQFPEDKGEVGVQQAVPRLSQAQHVAIWDFLLFLQRLLEVTLVRVPRCAACSSCPKFTTYFTYFMHAGICDLSLQPLDHGSKLCSDFKSSVCLLCWHFWEPL